MEGGYRFLLKIDLLKLLWKVDLDLDFVQDQFIQAPVEGGDPRGVKVRQRVLHQAWRSTESYRWLKIYENGGDLAGGDGDDGGDLVWWEKDGGGV